MYKEEEDFIEKCKRGDSSAQEALYKKYASKLRMVCLRYTKTNLEADDIFQDAFIKVFSNIKNYSGQGSFEGWIKRIVINTAIDHYKNNSKTNYQQSFDTLKHDAIDDLEEDGFEKLANALSINDLLEIVNKLPEGYKMIFNLYAIEGYNHKEISELLQIKEGTSKSQLWKARKLLQNMVIQYNLLEK